jgi:hypothetical protein
MATSDVRVWDGTAWVSLRGPTGNTGAPGTGATVTVAGVTALPAGQQPTVTDSNPDPSIANLTFGIPAGAPGTAATITVGTVTSVPNGTLPTVTNVGSTTAARFDFKLEAGPQGPAGSGVTIKGTLAGAATALPGGAAAGDMYILGSPLPTAAPNPATGVKAEGDGIVSNGSGGWTNVGPIRGPQGPTGNTGNAGTNATVSVGTVTTGAAGSAAVVVDGDLANPNNVILNMTIPQGLKGDAGTNHQVYNTATTPVGMTLGAIWLVP